MERSILDSRDNYMRVIAIVILIKHAVFPFIFVTFLSTGNYVLSVTVLEVSETKCRRCS